MSETNWNASNYQKRKAQRQAKVPPRWYTNPETGEHFFLRRVGAFASVISGMMPSALTGYAVGQWKEAGLDVGDNESSSTAETSVVESQRDMKMMARVLAQSCVIPLLIPREGHKGNFDSEWHDLVCNALAEKYPDFDQKEFTPESIMLEAEELDDSDLLFIFRCATGQVGDVELKGGKVMSMNDLEAFRKKPGRRSRAGNNKSPIRETA